MAAMRKIVLSEQYTFDIVKLGGIEAIAEALKLDDKFLEKEALKTLYRMFDN